MANEARGVTKESQNGGLMVATTASHREQSPNSPKSQPEGDYSGLERRPAVSGGRRCLQSGTRLIFVSMDLIQLDSIEDVWRATATVDRGYSISARIDLHDGSSSDIDLRVALIEQLIDESNGRGCMVEVNRAQVSRVRRPKRAHRCVIRPQIGPDNDGFAGDRETLAAIAERPHHGYGTGPPVELTSLVGAANRCPKRWRDQ